MWACSYLWHLQRSSRDQNVNRESRKFLIKLRCEIRPTSGCNLETAQKAEYLLSHRGHASYIFLFYNTVVATPFRRQVHLDSTAVNRCEIARLCIAL